MLPPLDAAFLPKMDSSERSLDFLGGSKDHRYREAERFKYALHHLNAQRFLDSRIQRARFRSGCRSARELVP